jgi:hypothetical protein
MNIAETRAETDKHINEVAKRLCFAADAILLRAGAHDASKNEFPEVEVFAEFTPKLKGLTYNSDEYKACLSAMGPALAHHYAANRHHPEHFTDGVNGMTLIDLLEMLADWKAATLRHSNGDIHKSIEQNKARFGLSDQLARIFENTLATLEGDVDP